MPPRPAVADYVVSRYRDLPRYCTDSRMADAKGQPVMVGLERPYLDDDKDGRRDSMVSRFKPGFYLATIRASYLNGGTGKRKVDVWEFKSDDHDPATTDDTPDTDHAQIHIANFPWELNGCLATGTAHGMVQYKGETVTDGTHPREHMKEYHGVQGSTQAFEKFMRDSLAYCLAQGRTPPYIWVEFRDEFPAAA